MMLLRLAWRNIWRNRRRSSIILTSIVIGVTAMLFTDSLMRGFMNQMFQNQLGAHTSHMQIHAAGFHDNKTVQNFMPRPDSIVTILEADQRVLHVSRRIIAFGLLTSASSSSGVSFVGIDPRREADITTISRSLTRGRYLGGGANEIFMSERLAQSLDLRLGDRVVAMASTADGTVGSEMFRIVGLYQSASSAFDKVHVYIRITTAQRLLRVGDRVSEIAVIARSVDSIPHLKAKTLARLDKSYEVLSYQDLLPSLLSQLELTESMMAVFYFIIGLAMIFGVINTMLMSVFERIREFGVLKSIGMRNSTLFSLIELEALLLGLLGTLSGLGMGMIIHAYTIRSGLDFSIFSEALASYGAGAVIYPELNVASIATGLSIILGVCALAALYPAYRAMRLEPVHAMRYV